MTTSEVTKLFEDAALPREKRSIERYCEQGKLDCFKDPDEMRYYITRASADKLIGHLKELKERHEQPSTNTLAPSGPTVEHDVRPGTTSGAGAAGVKPETHENSTSETAIEEYEQRIKALEDENFLLKVGKHAAEQVVTMVRQQIKDDRDHYTKIVEQNNDKVTKYSRRLGQLETEIKHRQLTAPDRDTTIGDQDDLDDAATIEAEFSEAPASVHDTRAHVPRNDQ